MLGIREGLNIIPNVHRLRFQITVKTMCTQFSALATLLGAPERRIKLWEIRRVDSYTP